MPETYYALTKKALWTRVSVIGVEPLSHCSDANTAYPCISTSRFESKAVSSRAPLDCHEVRAPAGTDYPSPVRTPFHTAILLLHPLLITCHPAKTVASPFSRRARIEDRRLSASRGP